MNKKEDLKSREERIRKRDERLLKQERSWKRSRIGAIFLSIIHVLILFVLKNEEFSSTEEKKESYLALGMWIIFWLLIVSWLNLRLGHIDSIKLYRKVNPTDVKD